MQPVFRLIKWAGALVLAPCAVALFIQREWLGAAGCAAYVAIIVWSSRIDCWLLARRVRKMPLTGETVDVTLDSDGFRSTTPSSEGRVAWHGFYKGVLYSDGLLLLAGPGVFHWLPDAALVQGTAVEVRELVGRHVAVVRFDL